MKKILSVILLAGMLFITTACSSYARDYNKYDRNVPVRRSITESRPNHRRDRHAPEGHIPERHVPARHMPERGMPTRRVSERRQHEAGAAVPYEQNLPESRPYAGFPIPTPLLPNSNTTPPATRSQNPQPATPKLEPTPGANTSPKPRVNPTPQAQNEPAQVQKSTQATQATDNVLASHKTEFNDGDKSRTNNITRASNTINGHVVKPGETFSYNQTVGPTIERRGYEEGTIYVDGEKKKGFGGGVCQVSSTLSEAVEGAGLKITERHDHSRPVSYAKEGDEAATSYGGIDFKFKNDKDFPVVIHSVVQGGTISVSISRG